MIPVPVWPVVILGVVLSVFAMFVSFSMLFDLKPGIWLKRLLHIDRVWRGLYFPVCMFPLVISGSVFIIGLMGTVFPLAFFGMFVAGFIICFSVQCLGCP